jgi:hypothetical protein
MEDFGNTASSAARQVIGLFAASVIQPPDRDDVEIAALVLHGDDPAFMALFDAASGFRSLGSDGERRLSVSFSKVRAIAKRLIAKGEIVLLEKLVGGSLTMECYRRIRAAHDDPTLASHHMATAADHYADDVITSLSALLGRPAEGLSLPSDVGIDPSAISSLPFVCFLFPEAEDGTYA